MRQWFRTASAPFAFVSAVAATAYSSALILRFSPAPWLRPAIVLVVAVAVFLTAFVASMWSLLRFRRRMIPQIFDLQRERDQAREEISNLSRAFGDREARYFRIHEELETILGLDYGYCTFLKKQGPTSTEAELRREFEKYTSELLQHIASLFEHYTGSKCAACVKIFSTSSRERREVNYGRARPPRDPISVFTLARDPSSHYERHQAYHGLKEIYPYSDNTAFFEIKHVREINGCYIGNNLRDDPRYRNSNVKWRDLYNAVAVAALKNPVSQPVSQSIGFLCIDNKYGGFDEGSCKKLLECCASIVYYSSRLTLDLLLN